MKIVIDMLTCQTQSKFKEIGRYTYSFVDELINSKQDHSLLMLVNSNYPERMEELRQVFTLKLPAGSFLPYYHPPLKGEEINNSIFIEAASSFVMQAYERVLPDIILYPNVFEGWGEKGVVPLPSGPNPTAKRVALIQDFNPYLYPETFLNHDADLKSRYLEQFESLKNFDLLLAFSESTRLDALRLLGIEDHRVVNISAGINSVFKQQQYSKNIENEFLLRFGIYQKIIFCPDNMASHENLEVILHAFSELALDLRSTYQVVVMHVQQEKLLRQKMHEIGLDDSDLIICGDMVDEDLNVLYNLCSLLVFPPFYEGVGLPALESMACGTPVIAPNNSSIKEVLGREDVLFDPANCQSISSLITRVLLDSDFHAELVTYGLNRAKLFSWKNTAQLAWDAIQGVNNRPDPIFKQHIHHGKKKIALVTPWPPQKSGIAEYSQALYAILKDDFEIDIYSNKVHSKEDNVPIYPWKDLIDKSDNYDTVIYQMGNSIYHDYMFVLMQKVPGVIVLHDFYVGDLKYFLDSSLYKDQNYFINQLFHSHGVKAAVDIKLDIGKELFSRWPINYDIYKKSLGLIVHSNFTVSLMKQYYPNGWSIEQELIRQPMSLKKRITTNEKNIVKQKLGLDPSDFLICSFGLLVPHKKNELIIEAFEIFHDRHQNARLIFVGDFGENNNYATEINAIIMERPVSAFIKITGYVTNEIYSNYLDAGDIAIQLRLNSRGETSRAVLDCMSSGTPVIVNEYGTVTDYYDGVVKISAIPDVNELVNVIEKLFTEKSYRNNLALMGMKYIEQEHSIERIVQKYSDVINLAAYRDDRYVFAKLGGFLKTVSKNSNWLTMAINCSVNNTNLRGQPRLLIDVTYISTLDRRTGIQRVVKNIINELATLETNLAPIELVRMAENRLFRAARYTEKLFNLQSYVLGNEIEIIPLPGDQILMLDSTFAQHDQYPEIFGAIRKQGGRTAVMVYDLIPVKHPETCDIGVQTYFVPWLETVIKHADDIVCISRAVADDVLWYKNERKLSSNQPIRLSYIHLGANIPVIEGESTLRNQMFSIKKTNETEVFVMVGTLEPRKGHSFVIDVFDELWKQGNPYKLCILGKVGWNVEKLHNKIRTHREFGEKLIFIENPSDAEINYAYSLASGLIAASIDEGFGLPIVEAAMFNKPVIASDIPVFREVGGDGAIYFELNSITSMKDAILKVAGLTLEEKFNLINKIEILSWHDCAKLLQQALRGEAPYKMI